VKKSPILYYERRRGMTTTTTTPSSTATTASSSSTKQSLRDKLLAKTKKGKIRASEFLLRVGYGVVIGIVAWLTLGVVETLGLQNTVKTSVDAHNPAAAANAVFGFPTVIAITLVVIALVLVVWPIIVAIRAKAWRQLAYLGIFALVVIIFWWLAAIGWLMPPIIHWSGMMLATPTGALGPIVGVAALIPLVYVVLFRIGATSTKHSKISSRQRQASIAADEVRIARSQADVIGARLEGLKAKHEDKKVKLGNKSELAEKASNAYSDAVRYANDPKRKAQKAVKATKDTLDEAVKTTENLEGTIGGLTAKIKTELDGAAKAAFVNLRKKAIRDLGVAEEEQIAAERHYNSAMKALEKSGPMKKLKIAKELRDKTQAAEKEMRDKVKLAADNVEKVGNEYKEAGKVITDKEAFEATANKKLAKVQKTVRGRLFWWWAVTILWIGAAVLGSGGWMAAGLTTFNHITHQPGW
jgi:hypothetical protein